jgi:hypothetical protein
MSLFYCPLVFRGAFWRVSVQTDFRISAVTIGASQAHGAGIVHGGAVGGGVAGHATGGFAVGFRLGLLE